MKILVIAPHPDDETLGCGGMLLRKAAEGHELGWLIVTAMLEDEGWSKSRINARETEIDNVSGFYGFSEVFNLQLPTAKLDCMPLSELVQKFSDVFKSFQPEEVYLPSPSDAHSDHKVVYNAGSACTKWFRYPSVKRVLAYETISETEQSISPGIVFQPNVFVDVADYLTRKLEIMSVYESEVGEFPFPRSLKAIEAQALLRGASSGFGAAEAFELLRERQ